MSMQWCSTTDQRGRRSCRNRTWVGVLGSLGALAVGSGLLAQGGGGKGSGDGDDGGAAGIFFSSTCPTDLFPVDSPFGCGDGDQVTGPGDLAELLANWGACANCCADVFPVGGGDDVVGPGDLAEVLANWGECPVCGHPDAGSCFSTHGPGCANNACCQAVCALDSFCCDISWDGICVGEVWDLCDPENDDCDDAFVVNCGDAVFGSTENAANDPPPDCGTSVDTPGIWYRIVGTGQDITVDTCSFHGYDTKISVYTTGFFLFSCSDYVCIGGNDDACGDDGLASSATWPSEYGETYRILVHGFGGQTGDFTLTVTCDGECGEAGSGSCFQSNGTPFCDDADCCNTVCEIDDFCCEVTWDSICASEAAEFCANCGAPGAGDCFVSNGSVGCNNLDCCEAVCAVDPFCCEVTWDSICADLAGDLCAGSNCCVPNGGLGCQGPDCEDCVCGIDPFCCDTEWDQICADEAADECAASCPCD